MSLGSSTCRLTGFFWLLRDLSQADKSIIDKINNIARYNFIDTKYHQMAFRSARWRCSHVLFGSPWSNKSEWWPPEGDNPLNLLFSSWVLVHNPSLLAVHLGQWKMIQNTFGRQLYQNNHYKVCQLWKNMLGQAVCTLYSVQVYIL